VATETELNWELPDSRDLGVECGCMEHLGVVLGWTRAEKVDGPDDTKSKAENVLNISRLE